MIFILNINGIYKISSLHRHYNHIKNEKGSKATGRNNLPWQPQLQNTNRRQFENVRISFTSEIIFSVFLLIILFLVGFVLGYNFSGAQSSLFFGNSDTTNYPTNSAISNTDTKTITTYSNSSVTNTNNDKDTITNNVSG